MCLLVYVCGLHLCRELIGMEARQVSKLQTTTTSREVARRNFFITRVEKYHHMVQEQKPKGPHRIEQKSNLSVSQEFAGKYGEDLNYCQIVGKAAKSGKQLVKLEQTEKRERTARLDQDHAAQDRMSTKQIASASFGDVTVLLRPSKLRPSPISEVNLAAVAVELKVRVKAADMPALLQEQAFRYARECLDGMEKLNCRGVALTLKKQFDRFYGPAWHCIVGTSFGSFVTHSLGGFLYFSMDKVSVLLFKTTVERIEQ